MNGRTVMMTFPDGSEGPVPVRNIAEARKLGASIAPRPKTSFGRPMPTDIIRGAADALPVIGSMGGSIAGGAAGAGAGAMTGPGASAAIPGVAMAGRTAGGIVGGAAGQAAREGIYRALGDADAPGSIGQEVRTQAMLGPLGEGLGAVARGGGRLLIRTGLPAKMANAGQAVGEMIRERLPIGGFPIGAGAAARNVPLIGPSLVQGSREAAENFGEKAVSRAAVNTAAEQAGVTIERSKAENVLQGLIAKAEREMADPSEVAYFKRVLKVWQRSKNPQMTPSEVQAIVTRYNKSSKPVFKAMGKGESIPSSALQQKATQRMAIAEELGSELEQKVPGWREYTSRLSDAIAAKDAIKAAEHMGALSLGSRLATGGAIGGGLDALSGERNPHRLGASALIGGAALANPALLSRAGLLFNDPLLQLVLQQGPRAYRPPQEQ